MKIEIFQKANAVFKEIRSIDSIIESHRELNRENRMSYGFCFYYGEHKIYVPEALTDSLISVLEKHRVVLQNEFDQL